MSLSEDQIQEYGSKGVLRVRGALSFEDLQPVIEELEEIIDRRARQLHAEGEIEELWENEAFEIRYGLLYRQSRSMGEGWISCTTGAGRPSDFSATTDC